MKINLFGSTTPSGNELKNIIKANFSEIKVTTFSRSESSDKYFDFEKPDFQKIKNEMGNAVIISFSPIWHFADFFEEYIENFSKQGIKGVIVCSSSSVITKNYAYNNFDKNLVNTLKKAEEKIMKICTKFKINYYILRPTLIYGKSGIYQDNNIKLIIKIMRMFFFIPLPSSTGLRQPIHVSELAYIALNLSRSLWNKDKKFKRNLIFNIGGESEISYENMLKSIKRNLPKKDRGRNCIFIKIPNRLFTFLISVISLIKPKSFEAIMRINSNMANFTKASYFCEGKAKYFPVKPFI